MYDPLGEHEGTLFGQVFALRADRRVWGLLIGLARNTGSVVLMGSTHAAGPTVVEYKLRDLIEHWVRIDR